MDPMNEDYEEEALLSCQELLEEMRRIASQTGLTLYDAVRKAEEQQLNWGGARLLRLSGLFVSKVQELQSQIQRFGLKLPPR